MAAVGFSTASSVDLNRGRFLPSLPELCQTVGGAILGHAMTSTALAQLDAKVTPRVLVTVLVSCFCCLIIVYIDRSTVWGGQATFYMFSLTMQSSWLLVLSPLVMDPDIQFWPRLGRAASATFSPRPPSKQSMSLPSVATPLVSENGFKDARTHFYRKKMISIAWTSAVYYIMEHRYRIQVNELDFEAQAAMPLFYRLSNFDLNKFLTFLYTEALGDFQQYCMLEVIHSSVALCAVFFFNSNLADWPPLYGDIRDAYTMARFYSHWWHKVMRKQLIENGKMLIRGVVVLPAYIRNSRYATIFAALLVSALVHGISMSPSLRCLDTRCIVYFSLLPPVFILEEKVQFLYHRYLGTMKTVGGDTHEKETSLVASKKHDMRSRTTSKWRFAGYIWVLFYKCWIIPRILSSRTICF